MNTFIQPNLSTMESNLKPITNTLLGSGINSINPVSSLNLSNNIDLNQNYNQLGHDFLINYCNNLILGVSTLQNLYAPDALCSINIFKQGQSILNEVQGFLPMKNKFSEYQINITKLKDISSTFQPIGKNSIIICFCGKSEINSIDYTFNSVIIIKTAPLVGSKIINQIFQFFL